MKINSTEMIVTNSIVLSAFLFGSIYLFSTSLIGLNKKMVKNESLSLFEIVNGSILILSGTGLIITGCKALRL
jgi:hypothetical protein